jgi:HAD superfamily hydrolase (TIGR01549 family)
MFLPKSVISSIDYVFVDFYDTLMFRKIHSSRMMEQWDRSLSKKLGIEYGLLTLERKKIISEMGNDECAINYRKLCSQLFWKLSNLNIMNSSVSEEIFYTLSFEVETYLELGVQYINKEIYRFLKKANKYGKKIVIISDFYLPVESYKIFGRRYELNQIIDEIFCSSDLGITKKKGEIYEYVLRKLNIKSSQAIMIGDSKISDKINAENAGIKAYRYFPVWHKIKTNVTRLQNCDCRNQCRRNVEKSSRKDVVFGEYALPLAYFTKSLYTELYNVEEDANFLSRGGFFLKKLMDEYQYICIPNPQKIRTSYVLNSRKVNLLAQSDENAKRLLEDYIRPYVRNGGVFSFVDEGWYGNGQLIFTRTLGLSTHGYYLGLMRNYFEPNCKRQGILFGLNEKNEKSSYYGIFRTNCTFYEQILTAPHGSVKNYIKEENGEIRAELVDNEKERKLYENYTKQLQEYLMDYCKALFVWDCDLSSYDIANFLLRPLLFANKKKRMLLNIYEKNYFNNAVDNSKKNFGQLNQIKINIGNLICCPEDYMRYFVKLKEKCTSNILYALYLPFGVLIYCYCKVSILVKSKFKWWSCYEE